MLSTATIGIGIAVIGGAYLLCKNLKKKANNTIVMISKEVAEYQHKMKSKYQEIEETFKNSNLDITSISNIREYYHHTSGQIITKHIKQLIPKRYDEYNTPMNKYACRLIVIPLDESSGIINALSDVTIDIVEALPDSIEIYMTKKEFYHITLFHTSRYDWQTLDPFVTRTIFRNLKAGEVPSSNILSHEKSVISDAVKNVEAPVLYLEEILLADSGTVLALWMDKTTTIKKLREKFKEEFPGAPEKQTGIIHTSLIRLLTAEPLPREFVDSLNSLCKKLTMKLKGLEYKPHSVWSVTELCYSTTEGEKEIFNFC